MELVHFVFPDKDQQIKAELPISAIINLFLGKPMTLPEEMILDRTIHFKKEGDVALTVAGNPTKENGVWQVPAEQQMASGNRG